MTREDNIKIIREACIKPNAEMADGDMYECETCFETIVYQREIRLADVLLAIQKANLPMPVETSVSRMTLEEPNELSLFIEWATVKLWALAGICVPTPWTINPMSVSISSRSYFGVDYMFVRRVVEPVDGTLSGLSQTDSPTRPAILL